jgi:hypothetical protein
MFWISNEFSSNYAQRPAKRSDVLGFKSFCIEDTYKI